MKFLDCLSCRFLKDEEVCEDCDSGENFEEAGELDFEDGNTDNDR